MGTTSHFLSEFVAAAANGEQLRPTIVESKKVVSEDEKVIMVTDTLAWFAELPVPEASYPSRNLWSRGSFAHVSLITAPLHQWAVSSGTA